MPMDNQQGAPVNPPADTQRPEQKEAGQVAKQALSLLYGDKKTYASMIDYLKKGAKDIETTVSEASNMIVGRLSEVTGGIDMAQAQEVIPLLVASMLELSEKAGFVPDVTGDQIKSAIGLTFKSWAEKNPDKVDMQQIEQMINSPQGQAAKAKMDEMQGSQEQPATQPGLLSGSA